MLSLYQLTQNGFLTRADILCSPFVRSNVLGACGGVSAGPLQALLKRPHPPSGMGTKVQWDGLLRCPLRVGPCEGPRPEPTECFLGVSTSVNFESITCRKLGAG